jgi:hypothetical protein
MPREQIALIQQLLRRGLSALDILDIVFRAHPGADPNVLAKGILDESALLGRPFTADDFVGTTEQELARQLARQREGVTAESEPSRGALSGLDPRALDQIAREEASLTRGGRQNIFEGFVGAQPGFNALNPVLQQGLGRAFNPLSAQFALQAAMPGEGGGFGNQNFRNFLGGGPQRFEQQDFRDFLAPVGAAFNAQSPTVEQASLVDAFSTPALQNNLMSSFLGLGISPFLRRFVPGAVNRQRTSTFESDPTANPFVQFLGGL